MEGDKEAREIANKREQLQREQSMRTQNSEKTLQKLQNVPYRTQHQNGQR